MESARFTLDLNKGYIQLLAYLDINHLEQLIKHKKSINKSTLRLAFSTSISNEQLDTLLKDKAIVIRTEN